MSAKLAVSCWSVSRLDTGTDGSRLPAPRSRSHADQVRAARQEKAHEPGPVVERAEKAAVGSALDRPDESGQARRDPDPQRADRNPVEAAGILVRAVPLIQIVHDQVLTPDEEIVRDHDPGDGPEQGAVAD